MSNQEQIKSLLGDDTITEETMNKLAELLESAIATAVEENTKIKDAEMETALTEKAAEHDAALQDALNEAVQAKADKDEAIAKADQAVLSAKEESEKRLDEAVQAASDRILTENRESFIALDRLERTERALETIKGAFELNGFSLNENLELNQSKVEVENITHALEEAKALNEELESALLISQCAVALNEMTSDLAATQREKIETMTESVEVSSVDEFRAAVALLIEQVKVAPSETLIEAKQKPTQSSAMAATLALLSRK